MYLLNRESVTRAFLIPTDIIQVLNVLPTVKDIIIKVPQDRPYAQHTSTKKPNRFWKIFFLSDLHNQTPVESL